MVYSKSTKSPRATLTESGAPPSEEMGIKSLVDYALDCARNSNFQEAKEALEQAKQRLEQ